MNYGEFIELKGALYYLKKVDWNRAVLWKTREISLRPEILTECYKKRVAGIVFVDEGKKRSWRFPIEKIEGKTNIKKVGQEAQCYFPIDLAIVKDYGKQEEVKSEVGSNRSYERGKANAV